MHNSQNVQRAKFSFIPGVKPVLSSLFFMIIGGTSAASSGDSWDSFIEALEGQKILQKEQAQEIKKHMQEHSSSSPRLDWHFKIHTQAAWTDNRSERPNDKSTYGTVEIRRLRLGASANLGNDMSAVVEVNLVPNDTHLHEAVLSWEPLEVFRLRVGYDKPISSLDENTSSSDLITVERSHISNTVASPGESTGMFVDGEVKNFYYGFGAFTDQEGVNTEHQAAKYLFNTHVGGKLNFGPESSLKMQGATLLSKDSVGQLGQEFERGLNLGFLLEHQSFLLQAEVLTAEKDGAAIEGGYFMPSYRSGSHQFVVRLEKANATSGMGFGLPGRYSGDAELLASGDLGDLYKSAYLGWNYHFDEITKVMVGAEGAELSGTSLGKVKATTVFLAWRAGF